MTKKLAEEQVEKKKQFPFQCYECGRFIKIVESHGPSYESGWWVVYDCAKCGRMQDGG